MLKRSIHFLLLPALLFLCQPLSVYADYLTPETWDATQTSFVDGRLKYRQFDLPIAPGIKDTASLTKNLFVDSGENLRDTVVKAPDTIAVIYDSGIVGNFIQYKGMVSSNWDYSKLALGDFSDAREAYSREGNWGILQSTYYVLKGSSRVVWAVAILNSSEALYQIGKATGQTIYYLLRYPVTGIAEAVSAPVILVGGTVWSTTASGVTTGWALPVTATIDGVHYAGESVWPK
jgi:hypothetical protein